MPRAPELLAVLAATKNARKRTDIGILGNQTKNANDKCARIGIVQSAAGEIVSAARASFSAGEPFVHAQG